MKPLTQYKKKRQDSWRIGHVIATFCIVTVFD